MVAPREILPFDNLNDAMDVVAETDSAEKDIEKIEKFGGEVCDDCDVTFIPKPENVEYTPHGFIHVCDQCQADRQDRSCP